MSPTRTTKSNLPDPHARSARGNQALQNHSFIYRNDEFTAWRVLFTKFRNPKPAMPPSALGTLYGVGLGPGDPDLITVKGLRILQRAEIIAFPAGLAGKAGIAEQIAAQWIQPHQTTLSLTFPYVQDDARLEQAWCDAAQTVWPYLAAGRDVVFLCEGDISFYSTFTYLAERVQHLYPEAQVKAIPGVCSPMAAAAAAGRPLTIRGQRLIVMPALYAVTDLATLLTLADVTVLMKVKSVYETVWTLLHERNLLDQSYVVEWVGWPHERIYRDLGDRPTLELSYFSLLIIESVQPILHQV